MRTHILYYYKTIFSMVNPPSLVFLSYSQAKGIDRPTSRLFSNPPGEFGSMVNEQIGAHIHILLVNMFLSHIPKH